MKTLIMSALVAAAAIIAPAALAQKYSGTPTGKEIAYIDSEAGKIRDRLKDPGSAQFSGMYVSRKGGSPIVCGYVNSKNSYGGYTGKQRFIGASAAGMSVTEDDMVAGDMAKVWARFC